MPTHWSANGWVLQTRRVTWPLLTATWIVKKLAAMWPGRHQRTGMGWFGLGDGVFAEDPSWLRTTVWSWIPLVKMVEKIANTQKTSISMSQGWVCRRIPASCRGTLCILHKMPLAQVRLGMRKTEVQQLDVGGKPHFDLQADLWWVKRPAPAHNSVCPMGSGAEQPTHLGLELGLSGGLRTVMTGYSHLLVYTASSLAEASTPRAIAFTASWRFWWLMMLMFSCKKRKDTHPTFDIFWFVWITFG